MLVGMVLVKVVMGVVMVVVVVVMVVGVVVLVVVFLDIFWLFCVKTCIGEEKNRLNSLIGVFF